MTAFRKCSHRRPAGLSHIRFLRCWESVFFFSGTTATSIDRWNENNFVQRQIVWRQREARIYARYTIVFYFSVADACCAKLREYHASIVTQVRFHYVEAFDDKRNVPSIATRHRQTDKINETLTLFATLIHSRLQIHVREDRALIFSGVRIDENRSKRGVTSTEHTRFHWNFGNGRVHPIKKKKKRKENRKIHTHT